MRPQSIERSARAHGLARIARLAVCLTALTWGTSASAQFANHSIGFAAGYLHLEESMRLSGVPNVGLDFTLYIDAGFEVVFRPWVGLTSEAVTDNTVVGFGMPLGVRYLFTEEALRPYAGLALSTMIFPGSEIQSDVLLGLNPFVGFEVFVGDNTAFGLQLDYQRILVLNDLDGDAFGGTARLTFGF